MNIKDYAADNSIVVPVETLQNDLTGKFIMVAVKEKMASWLHAGVLLRLV